jgi:hypothetical protein
MFLTGYFGNLSGNPSGNISGNILVLPQIVLYIIFCSYSILS